MEIFSSYTGADFLVFYLALLVGCVAASLWIPANLRPHGRRSSDHFDAEEMAVLSGGPVRHALTVATDLMVQGGLSNASSGKMNVARTQVERASPAGQSVLRKVGAFDIRELCFTTSAEADAIRARLVRRGLLMSEGETTKLRWQSIAPFVFLLILGLYRTLAGSAQGEPIGFLVVLMIVTAGVAILRFSKLNRRTLAGERLLRDEQARTSRLERAPQAPEASYAVALFGTGVLIGTPWEAVNAMRSHAAASSGDGGGGCGGGDSGCGGGGCGGGGCGGCGG